MILTDWRDSPELPWSDHKWSVRGMGIVNKIILHQAAGAYAAGSARDLKGINNYMISADNHITPGHPLPHIPYHFVIDDDGTVYWCNDLTDRTFHAMAANATSIGVCLIGDFDSTPDGVEPHLGTNHEPTAAQMAALAELIPTILEMARKPLDVFGHTEIQQHKPYCPGDSLMFWIEEYRAVNPNLCS